MEQSVERRRLLGDLDDFIDSAKALQESLIEIDHRLERMKSLIDEGTEVTALLSSFVDPGEAATNLTEGMEALELARCRTRRPIVDMGRAEGLSLAQLAEFWGGVPTTHLPPCQRWRSPRQKVRIAKPRSELGGSGTGVS